MEKRYYINYHTGAGNQWVFGSLDEAMDVAEYGLSYTQQPVTIEDEKGNEILYLSWYDGEPEEDEVVTCQFGDRGYYGEWVDLEEK